MPIGGVVATKEVVVPNAVGVDIGCGMCAVRTSLNEIDPERLKLIMAQIRSRVPLGFKHHRVKQSRSKMPAGGRDLQIVGREYESALTQIGTLGGGNHFIEIQRGSDDRIWLMVHSGSRNLGFKVAQHYNRLAVDINSRRKDPVPKQWQLAHLELASVKGQAYLEEMRYCVEFALANRSLMMERIKEAVADQAGPVSFEPMINIAHNYAALETHFKTEVLVHRKGSTKADEGLLGIVPGSQGSSSYIVRGLGNSESFRSCAHGAGRRMGRKEAIRKLDLQMEIKRLDNLGVIHAIRSKGDLDEAASAYKDISEVMRQQGDLIDIEVQLTPLAVIKG
jgi:tRNA-splicing ligase RtcB